jgi:hypothetical protein
MTYGASKGRAWCDEADAWWRTSELAQHVSQPKPPPSTAAELRARMEEQLFQDRLIYGTSMEKLHADGSTERVHPAAVLTFGKAMIELLPSPTFEAEPEPRLRQRSLALASLPLDAWRKST